MKTVFVCLLALVLCLLPVSTCKAQEFKQAGDVANLTSFVAISTSIWNGKEILTLRARQNREMMFSSNMSNKTIATIQSDVKVERFTSSTMTIGKKQLALLNESFDKLQINTIANFDPLKELEEREGELYIIIMVRTEDGYVYGYSKRLKALGPDKDKIEQFVKVVLQISSELGKTY